MMEEKKEGMEGGDKHEMWHGHDHMHGGMNHCCGWGWYRFGLLRMILLLFILAAVFYLGFKLGEIKGGFYSGYMMDGSHWGFYGRHMMYQGDDYEPGMMGGCPKTTTTQR